MNGATLINRLIVLIHLGPPFSFIVFLLFIPVCCHPLAIFVIFSFFFLQKENIKRYLSKFFTNATGCFRGNFLGGNVILMLVLCTPDDRGDS